VHDERRADEERRPSHVLLTTLRREGSHLGHKVPIAGALRYDVKPHPLVVA
jgi:hypothetical protein